MFHAIEPRKYDMQNKFAVATVTGLITLLLKAPENVKTLLFVVFMLIGFDMITAIAAAIACKSVRSSHMREKLVMKLLQYLVISAIFYSATVIAQTWYFLMAGLGVIATIEVTSMLENLVKWQKYSGVNLGPVSGALMGIGQFFQTDNIHAHKVLHSVSILPTRDDEPVIQAVSIETIPPDPMSDRSGKL